MKALAGSSCSRERLLGAAGRRELGIWKSPWRSPQRCASSRHTALVIAPRAMVIMQRILSYLAQKIIVQQLAQSPAFQRLALRIAAQLKKGEAWVQAGARPHPKKPAVSERAQQEARRRAGKTAQQEAREFQQAQQAADGGGLDLAGTRRRAGALASAFFEELEKDLAGAAAPKKPPR